MPHERYEFCLPNEGEAAIKSLQRAKPLAVFLQKHPGQQDAARKLALRSNGGQIPIKVRNLVFSSGRCHRGVQLDAQRRQRNVSIYW
jgi:hypothetical protein